MYSSYSYFFCSRQCDNLNDETKRHLSFTFSVFFLIYCIIPVWQFLAAKILC